MEANTNRRCDEWPLLTEEEIQLKLSTMIHWTVRIELGVNKLIRSFQAKNFQEAINFFNAVCFRIVLHSSFIFYRWLK